MNSKPFAALPGWITVVLAMLSMLGTVYMETTHRAQDTEHRLSTLEQAHTDDSQRLDRIESQVNRLVDGLLPH